MDLVFAVISDVHIRAYPSIEDDKLRVALSTINEVEPHLDAMVITGDFTNRGSEKEYRRFNKIYNKNTNNSVEKVFLMGNHDYWNGLSLKGAQKRFRKNMHEDIHSHKVIKGYHFIAISTEGRKVNGVFGEKLLLWFRENLELARKDNDKKPIFLGVHQHIKDTVYGSDRWGNAELYNILKEFPQVITFSGHSHYPLNDERSIHQRDFTSIGVASTSYIEMEKGKLNGSVPPKADKVSQGLIVKVGEDNKVKISTLDFSKNALSIDKWVVEEPSNKNSFIYLDERKYLRSKPFFKEDGVVEIKSINHNSAKISFSQAYHKDFIHSYKVQIINKNTNNIFKQFSLFSDFYREFIKVKLSLKIKGLTHNTEYIIKIWALESFGNESENCLSISFKTDILSINTLVNSFKEIGKLFWITDLEKNSVDID